MLCRDDGTEIRDHITIANEFVLFYENLFGKEKLATPLNPEVISSGPTLNESQSVELINPISSEEIKQALV